MRITVNRDEYQLATKELYSTSLASSEASEVPLDQTLYTLHAKQSFQQRKT
jgi:hypothetical protein